MELEYPVVDSELKRASYKRPVAGRGFAQQASEPKFTKGSMPLW